ncbi:MAG: family 78 glycoside hydrolase catalytic domain [Eubacteriales bacterium]|nr:family 78 glycoside hydrolase catalytic domain [Eubacteriales bacterium]
MLQIVDFNCENKKYGCVTDKTQPYFSFSLESDKTGTELAGGELSVGTWKTQISDQIQIVYEGEQLMPFSKYEAKLSVIDNYGESAQASLFFETGRMDGEWESNWITDTAYHFTEKKISPVPMTFRKKLYLKKPVASAKIYATALGIYELFLDGNKVGNQYYAPGFTSYKNQLQYQVYDVTTDIEKAHEITAIVAGGWAVGSFVFTRKNRITAPRQALLLEIRIEYKDGSREVIGTDESWDVTSDGNVRMADWYDGEVYDASLDNAHISWRKAGRETLKIHPDILADYGAPVKEIRRLKPEYIGEKDGELIFDFKQNFAGIVELTIDGTKGQKIIVKHAEVLNRDGSLNTRFLRSARATLDYTCKDGRQTYSPSFTYMGFRYVGIQGISADKISVEGIVLSSDIEEIGTFACSDNRLNRLQENIKWSARANFMDIPTDCPQRDERMGWTGDIAVFSETASYNFNMTKFYDKWLKDVRSEQLPTGGIPNTVPAQGYGFPATMPTMAMDFWGDACVLVPWADYKARGNKEVLRSCYPMMKKYVNACRFWAGIGIGDYRYIWHTPSVLHFGDWIAPDVPKMSQWQKRSKWTATASLCNTSRLVARIADILGESEDAVKYMELSKKVAKAYRSVFTDKNGKLKEEFQTGYVLPLYFDMLPENEAKKAAGNLAELVKKNNYRIGTGFPGTPYILFALADHGYEDVAYRMLMNDSCPSWLYEVKSGATTIWERWDGLDENGECPISNDGTDMMVSYNHYASGAVGAFFYRRIAGIESVSPGFKKFRIRPVLDPNRSITNAEAALKTPYGKLAVEWKVVENTYDMKLKVPVGTSGVVTLPNGEQKEVCHGNYHWSVNLTD